MLFSEEMLQQLVANGAVVPFLLWILWAFIKKMDKRDAELMQVIRENSEAQTKAAEASKTMQEMVQRIPQEIKAALQ